MTIRPSIDAQGFRTRSTECIKSAGTFLQQAKLLKNMPRLDGPFNDTFKVCHTSGGEGGKLRLDPAKQDDNQPLLLITPTYERAEQVIYALRCPIKHLSEVP